MWARRWPGMKSSRLSPAGKPCMLGSRLEDTGCASCSFVCTLERRKEGRESLAGLDCLGPLDSTHWWGRKVGCGRELWSAGWELKDPGNRRLWAPACRLPVPTPRGTKDCLLGLGQELWVGVGEGKPGKEEDREAGQEQACSLLTTPLGLSVPG